MTNVKIHNTNVFQVMGLAIVIVSISFYWQGNRGLDLADEGFLWYGVQKVMEGEVPLRDFLSYDPGRYYWSACIMRLLGNNGIMALRASVALFQVLGLAMGLLLISQPGKKWNIAWLIMSAIIFIMWMYPRHKLYDISLSIFQVGILTFLASNPTSRRYFFSGVGLGLIAVFGRNHGVYGVIGSLGVIAWLNLKNRDYSQVFMKTFFWGLGIVTGYSPMFFMWLFIPGYADAFWYDLIFLLRFKATNLPLPVPWPWTASSIRGMFIGGGFILLLVFAILSIAWVVKQRFSNKPVWPTFVSAAFMSLPYAHYAYSRADVNHLCQGLFPLLVGLLFLVSILPTKFKWAFASMLCIGSVWVMYVHHPGFQNKTVKVQVSGDTLLVKQDMANYIAFLHELVNQYAPNGESIVVVPFSPGVYPLLNRKAPLREVYPLVPREREFQEEEIKRIKASAPGFIFIDNLAADGYEELRYSNTYPLVYRYVKENFQFIPNPHSPTWEIYVKVTGE